MGNPYLRILKELACYITDLIASGFNKAVDDGIVCIGEKQIFFFKIEMNNCCKTRLKYVFIKSGSWEANLLTFCDETIDLLSQQIQ